MTKTSYKYKDFVKESFSYITVQLEEGKASLQEISDGIREIVNRFSNLNRNDRYRLYRAVYEVARAAKRHQKDGKWRQYLALRSSYDTVLKASRRVQMQYELRVKRTVTRAALQDSSTVFFLCSEHSNPADGHKDMQGKVYVDRFWRTKVHGLKYMEVAAYIRNHKCMTVQDAMKEPFWLTTRPYCQHWFIPYETDTVLHNSQGHLRQDAKKDYSFKWYTEDDYYKLRKQTYSRMDKIAPCKEFKDKQKKRG